ncbi:MAG: hypothetical protein V4623_06690 [Pseudomonadota bacterium]
MSVKQAGLMLLGIAAAIFIGGPLSGFQGFFNNLAMYRKEKTEGREPTLEQRAAYHSFLCYVVSAALAILGGVMCLFSLIFGE